MGIRRTLSQMGKSGRAFDLDAEGLTLNEIARIFPASHGLLVERRGNRIWVRQAPNAVPPWPWGEEP